VLEQGDDVTSPRVVDGGMEAGKGADVNHSLVEQAA
jgi:hypothetical protein